MTDNTPTTWDVEYEYERAYNHIEFANDADSRSFEAGGGARGAFRRWLAAHELDAKARAWNEGMIAAADFACGPDWAANPVNPYESLRTT